MRRKVFDFDFDDVDDNGICEAQDPGEAASLTLDGALVADGVATLDFARQLVYTSSADDSGLDITVTGTDQDGNAQTETPGTGPSSGSVEGTKYFKTVTAVAVDGDPAGDISLGTVDEARSATIPVDSYLPEALVLSVDVTGTINYTIQETFDTRILTHASTNFTFVDVSAFADKTADVTSTLTRGATGWRLEINSYTNGAEIQVYVLPSRGR
jgi:hypothetical protein